MDIERPKHAIGKGTEEAIQSGVVYGYAGQVDGILGRLREELGEQATAIATGGYAAAITPFCDQVDEVDDLLTLRGLKLIWEKKPRLGGPALGGPGADEGHELGDDRHGEAGHTDDAEGGPTVIQAGDDQQDEPDAHEPDREESTA